MCESPKKSKWCICIHIHIHIHQVSQRHHQGFMSGGKGFVDFANPSGRSPGACGALLPEDDSKLPVLFRTNGDEYDEFLGGYHGWAPKHVETYGFLENQHF